MIAKLGKIYASYRFLIFQSVLIMLLLVELVILGSLSDDMFRLTADLQKKFKSFRTSQTEETLKEISAMSREYDIPTLQKQEARSWLLEAVEEFRSLYGAKVLYQVTEDKSSYRIGVGFSYSPERPEDAVRLLQYMRNSVSPIYRITGIEFKKAKDLRVINIMADIVQPYKGGQYEY